jgi:small subunit ribosomal protein S6
MINFSSCRADKWHAFRSYQTVARHEIGVIPRKGEVFRMRNYELAYILDPELDEQSIETFGERVKGWIEAAGGTIKNIDGWGKRRLAYPIKKHTEGYYYFLQIEMPPQAGVAIERDLRLSEQILRFMISVQEPV